MNELFISEIKINKHSKEFDASNYPFSVPVIKYLDSIKLESNVTFFVGENGTGKSTILEAIAACYGLNPEGGSKNFNFSTSNTHSALHEYLTFVKGIHRPKDSYFLRAESFYNVASQIETYEKEQPGLYDSYGGKSLHHMSHGESFFSLIQNRFWGNGLYLLDEPESALSPQRQLALLVQISDLVKENSQFIIATHSPILLAYPDAQIFVLSEKGIALTPYEETEHYIITKQFLNNTDGMLRHLLD